MKRLHGVISVAAMFVLAAAGLGACATGSSGAAQDELRAFPGSLAGHQRHVIALPERAQEQDLKIELIGGRQMQVDCNTRGLDGRFEERTVEGWGYTYWVLQSKGNAYGTMMMCPSGSEKPGFVQAPSVLVRYASKLPLVVFVPDGFALRWRVWSAGATQEAPAR